MVSRRSICNSDDADSEGRRREAREVKMMMMMKMTRMRKMMKMRIKMKIMMKMKMIRHFALSDIAKIGDQLIMMMMTIMMMMLNIREAIHIWSFLWERMAAMMSSTIVLR